MKNDVYEKMPREAKCANCDKRNDCENYREWLSEKVCGDWKKATKPWQGSLFDE